MRPETIAVAGTLESSDVLVTVEPWPDGIELSIESVAFAQYGRQIRETVLETLARLEVDHVRVTLNDRGALDCTIKARVERACLRSCNVAIDAPCPWRSPARISRPRPKKDRLRRSMLFMNAQRPGLIKDAYVYGADSIMLDLEDAVAEDQKDAARSSLFHALREIDYGDVEVIVRINGLDTPHWREDVRVCVAGGADGIRIAKTESARDVKDVEAAVLEAEREHGVEEGRTLLMAAIESPMGVLNAYEICTASDRLFGIALSGGDYRRCMQVEPTPSGIELLAARGHMLIAARAAGVQCFDTVFTDLDDEEGFRAEVRLAIEMGFDGKSLISPRQIPIVHQMMAPGREQIARAEAILRAYKEHAAKGVGVFVLNGKMIDVAFVPGAERTIRLAKASGVYGGDL